MAWASRNSGNVRARTVWVDLQYVHRHRRSLRLFTEPKWDLLATSSTLPGPSKRARSSTPKYTEKTTNPSLSARKSRIDHHLLCEREFPHRAHEAPSTKHQTKLKLSSLLANESPTSCGYRATQLLLYVAIKVYYVRVNAYRDRKWNAMSSEVSRAASLRPPLSWLLAKFSLHRSLLDLAPRSSFPLDRKKLTTSQLQRTTVTNVSISDSLIDALVRILRYESKTKRNEHVRWWDDVDMTRDDLDEGMRA